MAAVSAAGSVTQSGLHNGSKAPPPTVSLPAADFKLSTGNCKINRRPPHPPRLCINEFCQCMAPLHGNLLVFTLSLKTIFGIHPDVQSDDESVVESDDDEVRPHLIRLCLAEGFGGSLFSCCRWGSVDVVFLRCGWCSSGEVTVEF